MGGGGGGGHCTLPHPFVLQNCVVHNDHLDWLFHWNIFPLRESTSIMSGNGKGFTLNELFRSRFTELWPSFPFNSISKVSGWTFKCFVSAF